MDFNDLLVLAKNQGVSKEEIEEVNKKLPTGFNRPIFARYLEPDERTVVAYSSKERDGYMHEILGRKFSSDLPFNVPGDVTMGIERDFMLVFYSRDSLLGCDECSEVETCRIKKVKELLISIFSWYFVRDL